MQLVLYSHICTQHHNDTINKQTQEDFLINICTSHFIVRVRKGYSGFACEREFETEHNCNILTPTLMAVSVVSFLFSWCSTGGLAAQLSAGWWLSLLHLISIFSGPQLIMAPEGPFGRVWLSLPHLVYNSPPAVTVLTSVLTELYKSSAPTQSPTRSLKSHVMQFTGHSLPVHQSMSVPWEFFLLRPISSANFRPRNFLS